MYSFLANWNKYVPLRTGKFIKVNCRCSNQMLHCRKIDKFLTQNIPPHNTSKIVRVISSSNLSYHDYHNINVNSKQIILLKNNCSLHSICENFSNTIGKRNFHFSSVLNAEPNKPSSKVEETVEALKVKVKEKENVPLVAVSQNTPAVVKKSLKQRIVDEIVHYYHGFRLLFIDIKVSSFLLWRVLKGNTLTRREHKLLIRTVGDMFRLVPFSVFIIVPFMELLLPVFIKFFPGMLPSTFQTATEKEEKIKQSLKVKLEMAKFLQQTLDDMAVTGKGHSSKSAKEFAEFFEKIRKTGAVATNEEIMKFSKLFHDEITLDSLTRPQLMALCRVLDLAPFGTNNVLRFQLRMKLRSLAADDKMIQKEGIDSLSQSELQQACRARGMRALGMSEERLKAQLAQWLDLSLNEKVPPSLLLLSCAFMLPETITTTEKLAATISALPDTVATKTKAVIGELEGKVDNKTKIEVIKEEVARIKEERKEQKEEIERLEKEKAKDRELLVDKAQVLEDKAKLLEPLLLKKAVQEDMKKQIENPKEEAISTKDLEVLEHALDSLGKDKKKLLVEKEELDDLKEEMADYEKDVADLKQVTQLSDTNKDIEVVQESTAAKRLSRSVTKMISKMDQTLLELEKKEKAKKEHLLHNEDPEKTKDELIYIDEIIQAIQKFRTLADSSQVESLSEVLGKIDADRDGAVKVEDVLKVLELIGRDNVKLSKKQVDEIIDLMGKEEAIKLDTGEKAAEDLAIQKDSKLKEQPTFKNGPSI